MQGWRSFRAAREQNVHTGRLLENPLLGSHCLVDATYMYWMAAVLQINKDAVASPWKIDVLVDEDGRVRRG